ncbi:D-alanine--D-alanine ligase [Abditibacterium utsteinense]|uniref:D-alanine--D-alanine ligase n=1 Tax=Abditibacterium utsteinense TaxID=1960156 RepID=A0A2S8SSK6_9BACT|nr:D-alanine--D-alanine ligase [Abditibacterium utsteinense]PQV63775.1 D-alanine--D-alanine ligase [Abditibacterium utsteinense]
MNDHKISVAVLMGGDSSERSVSFSSGRAVADALDPEKYVVTCFDVSNLGHKGDISRSDAMGRKPRHAIFPVSWDHLATALYTNGFDAIFPVLHGGRGEDGTLQTLLEVAELSFVGSQARPCAIAIDKPLCKAYLREFGIQSPRGTFISSVDELDSAEISFPCVVKPASGGSSVGTSILQSGDAQTLRLAVARALLDGSGALVEEFVSGTEVTCAVWGEAENAKALPVIEIVPQLGGGFYDFEAKYASGGSNHLIPPRLGEDVQREIQRLSLQAHRALGARGVTRSDFIVTGEGKPLYLETNTTPGLTETSLVPDAARAAGMEFSVLVESLLETALPTRL